MRNRISMDRNEENQVKTLKNREVELKIQLVLLFCNSKAKFKFDNYNIEFSFLLEH